MQFWIHDVKFGVKLLWKNKAFAAAVLLTLGVCIAANSTIFSSILHATTRRGPIYSRFCDGSERLNIIC